MRFHISIVYQIIIALAFSIIFFVGSLALDGYISIINQEKSVYPVLIYTNTLNETNNILDFVGEHRIYSSFNITTPENLESMLIEKYGFTDFRSMAKEFTLPFLLEIYIYPFPSSELIAFIDEITSAFPNYIIHYNENNWLAVDTRIIRLNNVVLATQILLLIIYLFAQLLFRLFIIIKNKENINAILNSGIYPNKLVVRTIQDNIWFLLASLLCIMTANYFVNYFLVFREFVFGMDYFNVILIGMLFSANVLLVLIQKPIYAKE